MKFPQHVSNKLLSSFRASARSSRYKEQGIWLSPGMLAFLIIAAITLSVWGGYKFLSSGTSVHIESNNLMMITSGAKSLKSGGSYANVDNAALQRIKAFGNMTGSEPGGTVRNGWNGTVSVTGTISELQIAYNGVPPSACDRLVAAAMNSGEFAEPAPTCSDTADANLTFIAY